MKTFALWPEGVDQSNERAEPHLHRAGRASGRRLAATAVIEELKVPASPPPRPRSARRNARFNDGRKELCGSLARGRGVPAMSIHSLSRSWRQGQTSASGRPWGSAQEARDARRPQRRRREARARDDRRLWAAVTIPVAAALVESRPGAALCSAEDPTRPGWAWRSGRRPAAAWCRSTDESSPTTTTSAGVFVRRSAVYPEELSSTRRRRPRSIWRRKPTPSSCLVLATTRAPRRQSGRRRRPGRGSHPPRAVGRGGEAEIGTAGRAGAPHRAAACTATPAAPRSLRSEWSARRSFGRRARALEDGGAAPRPPARLGRGLPVLFDWAPAPARRHHRRPAARQRGPVAALGRVLAAPGRA